ncbi:response regulator transcription factor [Aliigemmobacter aestuarii]|uniref:Response regulator transcription factor n=1 Tax=Aliigemmobacter aestuarii TaxID=1445661 RepID=A0A4V3V026_9RHOB|nr:response regulator transcription factor [Gemmobacter aestuarii]THD81411.1 response regulator transcription factor [Gemmobacter aestuarii]
MRLLIADDHDLVRETVAAFLTASGVEAVQSVATLDEALVAIRDEPRFDLILLDYNMPGMNGVEGVRRTVNAAKGVPVAVISGMASRELAEIAERAGAVGFVPKTLGAKAMVAAVRLMAQGERFHPLGLLSSEMPGGEGPNALTRRELDVLRGLVEGLSNKEIARDLDLQEVTVKLHVKTLSRKLGARNRTHAAMIARNAGMI